MRHGLSVVAMLETTQLSVDDMKHIHGNCEILC